MAQNRALFFGCDDFLTSIFFEIASDLFYIIFMILEMVCMQGIGRIGPGTLFFSHLKNENFGPLGAILSASGAIFVFFCIFSVVYAPIGLIFGMLITFRVYFGWLKGFCSKFEKCCISSPL